jgi:hypothetical protein
VEFLAFRKAARGNTLAVAAPGSAGGERDGHLLVKLEHPNIT